MSASTAKGQKSSISAVINTTQTHLFKQFPQHEPRLKKLLVSKFQPVVENQAAVTPTYTFKPNLPEEEVVSIVEKARQVSLLPGLSLDKETELYLEQQLEDVLGFGITSTLNSVKLPFCKGVAQSMPHLFDSPATLQTTPESIPEAGLSKKRPVFGWNMPSFTESPNTRTTKYWISLPIHNFVSESMPLASIKAWMQRRKVLIINPTDSLFAVVEVMDEYTSITNKYQLGVSPAVSREALLWSPQNLGKVLVFFISESSKTPQPGVYSLL